MNYSPNLQPQLSKKLIVQKYGGATLATPEKIRNVAKRIHQLHQNGVRLVVVVSAMGQTTNDLIQLAQKVSDRPHLREMDMLLTVGERISMSLLSMALNDLGCPAISFTGSQAGILTDEAHVNAKIIDVKGFRVQEALMQNKVVIMAGFQGVSPVTKEITTLGRGGSDISAVAMAGYLKADQCEILKDVDGVYTADPKAVPQAQLIPKLNLQTLLEMTQWGAKVLNSASVALALEKNVRLFVGPAELMEQKSTSDGLIGTIIDSIYSASESTPVALNSFGKVCKIKTALPQNEFQAKLTMANIGRPQVLQQTENIIYLTGPQEVLEALFNFEEKSDFYEILDKDICTVSLTYSKAAADSALPELNSILEKNSIKILNSFSLMNSVHFFIPTAFRDKALQSLHQIILSSKSYLL